MPRTLPIAEIDVTPVFVDTKLVIGLERWKPTREFKLEAVRLAGEWDCDVRRCACTASCMPFLFHHGYFGRYCGIVKLRLKTATNARVRSSEVFYRKPMGTVLSSDGGAAGGNTKPLRPSASRASFVYIPALDGMRAVAILLVILSHFGLDIFIPGGFGVTLFFFISGFLITRLLIAEQRTNGRISIRAFYMRRFLRLGPALITMIGIVSVTYFFFVGPIYGWEIVAAIFYAMNYYAIWFGPIAMPINVLWSLAIEEHYYAAFPAIFSLTWKFRERFIIWLLVVSAAVLLWRVFLVFGWHAPMEQNYYRTDTRIDSILYGAILAGVLELQQGDKFVVKLGGLGVFTVAILIVLLTFVYRNETFRETARYSLQGLALIPIFCAILFAEQFALARRILELPMMIWIGRLSYSLYLWHEVVLFFVTKLIPTGALSSRYLIALALSVATASVSYYCIEKPFQTLRKTYRRL
jgi:peptidoglycan/LPS O-acetylase OafA/YrhL